MQHCPVCIRKALATETKACPALCDGAFWDYLWSLELNAMATIPMDSIIAENDPDKVYRAPFYLAARQTDAWFVESVRAIEVCKGSLFRKMGIGQYRIRCEFLLCTRTYTDSLAEMRREIVVGSVAVEDHVSPIDAIV